MSWSLFIDEPSEAQAMFPYGVLAGLSLKDDQIWPICLKIRDAQTYFFGSHVESADPIKLLGKDVFINFSLYNENLDKYADSKKDYLSVSYCIFVLELLKKHNAFAFATITEKQSRTIQFPGKLRKDYGYLFERFFFFLQGRPEESSGFLIFDKHKEGTSTIKAKDITDYFIKTSNGQIRARSIVPEPLYSGGELSVLFQATAILSYVVSWGVRLPGMNLPQRQDMDKLVSICTSMRYSYKTENGKKDWSFKYLSDITPAQQYDPRYVR